MKATHESFWKPLYSSLSRMPAEIDSLAAFLAVFSASLLLVVVIRSTVQPLLPGGQVVSVLAPPLGVVGVVGVVSVVVGAVVVGAVVVGAVVATGGGAG